MSVQSDRSEESIDPTSAADAGFDAVLRSAMRARPEHEAPFDLAARAMTLARKRMAAEVAARTDRLMRQRRWAQITGLAATLFITALLAGAARQLWSSGDLTAIATSWKTTIISSDSTSSTTTDESDEGSATDTTINSSTSNATVSTSMSSTVAMVFFGEILVVGLVLLTITRNGQGTTWSTESLAGAW